MILRGGSLGGILTNVDSIAAILDNLRKDKVFSVEEAYLVGSNTIVECSVNVARLGNIFEVAIPTREGVIILCSRFFGRRFDSASLDGLGCVSALDDVLGNERNLGVSSVESDRVILDILRDNRAVCLDIRRQVSEGNKRIENVFCAGLGRSFNRASLDGIDRTTAIGYDIVVKDGVIVVEVTNKVVRDTVDDNCELGECFEDLCHKLRGNRRNVQTTRNNRLISVATRRVHTAAGFQLCDGGCESGLVRCVPLNIDESDTVERGASVDDCFERDVLRVLDSQSGYVRISFESQSRKLLLVSDCQVGDGSRKLHRLNLTADR